MLHPSVRRTERRSQHLVISAAELHSTVLPVAARISRIFGFQQRQSLKGALQSFGADVQSNSACQVIAADGG